MNKIEKALKETQSAILVGVKNGNQIQLIFSQKSKSWEVLSREFTDSIDERLLYIGDNFNMALNEFLENII